MKILFITSNRLGDVVLSTGVLAWLRKRYPEARMTVACGPHAAGLFRCMPTLERLLVLRKLPLKGHWLLLWRACICTRWDIIIDMRNSVVSRLLFAKLRVSKVKRVGQHKVVENAAVLGINPPPSPCVWIDGKAKRLAEQLLPAPGLFLALAPAANWACKQWPAEKFAELAHKLTGADGLLPHAKVMVIASKNERKQIRHLLEAIPDAQRVEIIGCDLLTVASCLKHARLFVGNDSGVMHMAAAVGIPTLGLFGPGEEHVYGPWGKLCAVVRTPESREELLKRLPYPGARSPNLMETLTVEKVLEGAKSVITLSQLDNVG